MKKKALMLSVLLVATFCLTIIIKNAYVTNAESQVNKLFMDKNKENNLKSIIKVISQIDWVKYNSKYGNGFDVIQWLYLNSKAITTEDEILSVLSSTNNLDGALSETYSSLIGSLFTDRQPEFISALSKLEVDQFELVITYLGYNFEYMDKSQRENIARDLRKSSFEEEKLNAALKILIKILEE